MPDWLVDLLARRDASGNTVRQWLAAVGVVLAAALALWLVRAVVRRRAAGLAQRRVAERPWARGAAVLADVARATRVWLLVVASAYPATLAVVLPEDVAGVVRAVAVIGLLVQGALWASAVLGFWIAWHVRERMATDAAGVTTITALGVVGRLAIWTLVALLALENAGVNVTALVAGLGIGGIAVALAAQNVLGDLFASLSIVLDRPFVLGDTIVVDGQVGTVERIGLRTTRLRSQDGDQLVFANNDLLKSRIRNFKRMQERRVLLSVGVTYTTTADTLAAIPGMLREAIAAQSPVRFERAHLARLGDSALVFEAVYFVLSGDHGVHMDVQQAINLAVLRRFAAEGIEFAYPTQTIRLEREGPRG